MGNMGFIGTSMFYRYTIHANTSTKIPPKTQHDKYLYDDGDLRISHYYIWSCPPLEIGWFGKSEKWDV